MKNLKYLRKINNLSQSTLAKILNVSQQQYAKYESDLSEPSKNTIINLANYFNVSTDEILDRKKIPKSNNLNLSKLEKKSILETIEILKKITEE